MSESLRDVRRRIKSVEGTKKMTHAMEMVAAAKLKRLQDLLARSDRYRTELERILVTLVREQVLTHPLLSKRPEVKTTLVFLITSDTGLCGSYNANVLDYVNQLLNAHAGNRAIKFVALGQKGAAHLRRKEQTVLMQLAIPRPQKIDDTIREVTAMATDSFRNREADEIVFIYTQVRSLAFLKPNVERLFPIQPSELAGTDAPVDYILEPDLDQIFEFILPEYVESSVSQFVKHSLVAEQASRMMAMRQATDNAKKMIDSLTRLRNKVRQATITKELIEVVSGSRAQKMK